MHPCILVHLHSHAWPVRRSFLVDANGLLTVGGGKAPTSGGWNVLIVIPCDCRTHCARACTCTGRALCEFRKAQSVRETTCFGSLAMEEEESNSETKMDYLFGKY